MFFSNKPNAIIYISRSSLSLFNQKKSALLEFPADAVQNLEVIDEHKLSEAVSQFASTHNMRKQRVLCLLDEAVIFQKLVPKNTDIKQTLDDFENKVPFEPAERGVIGLQVKDQQILLAANKKMYQTILHTLELLNCKIVAVSPGAVYGVDKAKLTNDQVVRILGNTGPASRANFLREG